VLAALVVGLVVGAALVSLLATESPDDGPAESGLVDNTPGEDSAEAGFVRDMMVHHAQAVQMADIVRDKTESQEIRTLAAGIALGQQAEIGQMRGWLQAWDLPPSGTEPAMSWMGHPRDGRMPGMAGPEEIDDLRNASPKEADVLFLRLMILHHEAAVPMAQAVLERTNRKEVEQLATAVAASQQAEVYQMQELLQRRGVPVEEDPTTPDEGSHGEGHGG